MNYFCGVHSLSDLLRAFYATFLSVAEVLLIGFVAFSWLEKMFTFSEREKPIRASLLDLQYVLLGVLYPPLIYFVIAFLFEKISVQLRAASVHQELAPGQLLGELLLVLFVRDILIYVRHRIFHTRKVWAFHSIHHSSEDVNWISAARFHPLESAIESAGEILLFLIAANLGVDAEVLSAASLLVGFYNLFIHANIKWTFGPLGYIFVSPVFHRWHHSDKIAAQDKNFAAMFSCLDLVLGTFYLPKNESPDTLGLSPEEKKIHPRSLWRQLVYPFRKN